MYRFFTITTALGLLGCDISVVENNEFVGETLVDTGDVEVADDDCTNPVVVYYDGDGDGFGDAALAVQRVEKLPVMCPKLATAMTSVPMSTPPPKRSAMSATTTVTAKSMKRHRSTVVSGRRWRWFWLIR